MDPESQYVNFLLEDFDYAAQLIAIRGLLSRQERADQELSDSIEKAAKVAERTRGRANDHAVEVHVELMQMSCYQDAAHSMAAVGTIAPFIESAFRRAFCAIGTELPQGRLVENIVKRMDEAGMKKYMPDNLELTLSALFAYRNKMFHGGFEWSSEALKRFEKRLEQSGWPSEWFLIATTDNEPWMFYMSPDFVDHCLNMAERVTKGIEEFDIERVLNS